MSFSERPKPVAPPSPPPALDRSSITEQQAVVEAERKRRRNAGGRASTVLSGAQGDLSIAPTASAVLLGSP